MKIDILLINNYYFLPLGQQNLWFNVKKLQQTGQDVKTIITTKVTTETFPAADTTDETFTGSNSRFGTKN